MSINQSDYGSFFFLYCREPWARPRPQKTPEAPDCLLLWPGRNKKYGRQSGQTERPNGSSFTLLSSTKVPRSHAETLQPTGTEITSSIANKRQQWKCTYLRIDRCTRWRQLASAPCAAVLLFQVLVRAETFRCPKSTGNHCTLKPLRLVFPLLTSLFNAHDTAAGER